MRRMVSGFAAIIGAALLFSACSNGGGGGGGGGGVGGAAAARGLGLPIPGLTQAELDAFNRGRDVFNRHFKPSEGLGPYYNATSCVSCHSTPDSGGSSPRYRNFYMLAIGPPGAQFPYFDPLLAGQLPLPGVPPSIVVPSFAGLDGPRPRIPPANDPFLFGAQRAVAQRNALPMFGTGLFEFISDATIIGNSDPDDQDGDGISGRFNRFDTTVGRLGVKAQANNIESFVRAPLNNQMGITTDPFEGSAGIASLGHARFVQVGASFDDPLTDLDSIPDPEMGFQDLGDLIAYTKFLGPPQPLPFTAAAQRGEMLFGQIGCAKCHIPTLMSSRGPVNAYTDLLIHDMGPALADGISQGDPQMSLLDPPTTENEFRTQPLWGVSLHAPFLHDGRADTLEEAILLHGGEAQAIRDAYDALPQTDKDDILAFLEAL